MTFLDQLNPQQREAVETAEGPILILAGAGSGKTRVITYRIAHLIEHLGVQPESILAVTFTNKAAQEMAERVEHLVGGRQFAKPWISTFHSMCVRMLRRDIEALRVNNVGYSKQFAIYDEADQQSLVKQAIRRLGLDDKQLTPRSVLARISWAKNHMLDPQEVFLQSSDQKSEQIAHVYQIYRQELRKANAMDFDDLLLETVRLLKVAEPVRHYWNRRFHYILIDEYQDTNRPQYELMRLLAGVHPAGEDSAVREPGGGATTSARWATRTSRSIPGAAPTSATSWSSSATFPTPKSSAWNRITAPPRTS